MNAVYTLTNNRLNPNTINGKEYDLYRKMFEMNIVTVFIDSKTKNLVNDRIQHTKSTQSTNFVLEKLKEISSIIFDYQF